VQADVDGIFETTAFLAFLDGLRLQYFCSDGAVSITTDLAKYVDQLVARITPDAQPSVEAQGPTVRSVHPT
jgi:hypothetical protein